MARPDGLSRDALVVAILEFIADQDLLARADIRRALEDEIDRAGVGALVDVKARLTADEGWAYYAPDPLARRIHHLLADRFLREGSELRKSGDLDALANVPVVLVANHLSYADANVIEVLLHRGGGAALADRLTALAGPKVFTSRQRRFSSLCFGTIKVPQSTDVASGEAMLSGREVARAARRAIDVARDRLRAGDALLLFGEGTRSRSGEMQALLAATARYLDVPGTCVLPLGLAGSETMFPVEGPTLRPARVVLEAGRPLLADQLISRAKGDRRVVMDAIGLAIAELLPPEYRGVYREPAGFADAMQVLRGAQGA